MNEAPIYQDTMDHTESSKPGKPSPVASSPGKQPQKQREASKHRLGKSDTRVKDEPLTHTLVTIAPDGGWAWVILAVSTWDCLCIDGVSLGYSVIQKQVTEHLKISGVQSSLFVSVFNCAVYLLGPITAAVANRFGFKILNLLGGALGAASLLACYWPQSFIYVMSFYGVLTGIGGAMIYMVSMAAPGYWFEKRRSLAFGVSNSASGIACLIIPPIAKLIDNVSHWGWVFMFLSCMFLVAFIFGFLIRKPPMMLVEVEGYVPEKPAAQAHAAMSMSIINVRGGKKANEAVRQMSHHANIQQSQKSPALRKLSDPSLIIPAESKCTRCWKRCTCEKEEAANLERPMYKSDIFLVSKADVQKTPNMTQADYYMSTHKMTTERDIREQVGHECVCCPEAIRRPLRDMLSLALLKNVVYLILLVDTMIYYSAIYVTYLFVPRTAERKGLGADTGILILQLFGGFMALSRISLGIIFYFIPNLPPHYFTSCYVIMGGVCHFALSLTTNKIGVCAIGAAMGFLIGVFVPMRSVLVVRYIGLEQLTNAMGMLFVFQAIGSLYGAPVAEALRNAFDEDYVTYYFAGVMYTTTGILLLPLECIYRILKKSK